MRVFKVKVYSLLETFTGIFEFKTYTLEEAKNERKSSFEICLFCCF